MSNLTRRQFVKRTAAFGAVSAIGFPSLIRAQGLNEKLQVGFIAVGGRAGAHTEAAHGEGCQCIAFAEVDKGRWGGVLERKGWGQAKGYTDWRKVFENHGKNLDVVFVATPDHTHFAPSMTAVSMGILLHRETPDLVGSRGATTGGCVRQESQGRHPAGQPRPWRQWLAAGIRIRQGRRGRRHQGVPHLDEPPDLAAGRRSSARVGSRP